MLSFQLLLLAFSVVSSTSASDPFQSEKRAPESQPLDDITGIEPYRSFVVKLDTPGYPRWIMDKAHAPPEYRKAAEFYHPTNEPTAVLLNFTLSSDNKTLYLNHHPILPLADTMAPPELAAYQVPANISKATFEDLKYWHLLDGAFFGVTIGYRYLTIDYDRLVWADPASGPYQNHVPTLRFRIMGLGAHEQDDILDDRLQKVVHVTLADQKHGSSDASDRSYLITEVSIKEPQESYPYAGVLPNNVSKINECPERSWRCEDHGLYSEGAPWYRYIWRHKFDRHGRIGSVRHDVVSRWDDISSFFKETWSIWVFTFVGVLGVVVVGYLVYGMVRNMRRIRLQRVQLLAEEDGLLGAAKDEEEEANFRNLGHDEDPPSYEDSVKPLLPPPPPLPPRPSSVAGGAIDDQDLIVLDDTETNVERGT